MATTRKDPRSKEELLNRVLSFDFNGDFRSLGAEGANVIRTAPNKLILRFPASGRAFEVVVRMPRDEQPGRTRAAVSRAQRATAKATPSRAGEPRSFGGASDLGFDPTAPIEPQAPRAKRGRPASPKRA